MAVRATFAADVDQSMGDLFDLLDALFIAGEIVDGNTVFYEAEVPTVSGWVDVDVFGSGFRYSGSGRNTFVSRGVIEDIDIYDRRGLAVEVENFGLSVPALNDVLDDDIFHPAALERYLMSGGWDALLSNEDDIANRFTRVGEDNVRFNLTGNDTLDGAGGDDDLYGGDRNDLLFGDTGFDTLEGGNGHDTLLGESGDDFLLGGNGDDSLEGGGRNDDLVGNDGFDTLGGGDGNDDLFGDGGNDRVFGNDGRDVVTGGSGNDRVDGDAGNDALFGGTGNDRIIGGSGNDRIAGEQGSDTVTGSSGFDRFEVNRASAFDRITDFTLGVDLVVVRNTGERFADIFLSNSSAGAVATGDGWTVLFDDIRAGALNASDFVFV